MLKPRQLETLANLKKTGLESAEDVINFCENKLNLPCKHAVLSSANPKRKYRKHSKTHYSEIISFMKGEL